MARQVRTGRNNCRRCINSAAELDRQQGKLWADVAPMGAAAVDATAPR